MTLQKDLSALVGEVSALYHERDEETNTIIISILAGQHTLLLGPPGTGKSAIVRELTSRITGGRYWEILLSRFTSPNEIFGPIDVGALAQGSYRQLLDGHATTAHVAFLDEIFKCGPAALNSMLAYLNERVYHPAAGGDPIDCPLIAAVAASNELPEDESTAALYDRILVRMEVDYLTGDDSFDALLRSAIELPDAAPSTRTTVELADLQRVIAREVPTVALGGTVRTAIRDLRADLRHREIVSSDRRWKQAVRLLQASAWLDDREHVVLDDLVVLSHVLWDVPSNKAAVDRLVRGRVSPDDREMADVADQIDQLGRELDRQIAAGDVDAMREWAYDHYTSLQSATRKLKSLRDSAAADGREVTWHDGQITHAERIYQRILVEGLSMDADAVAAQLGGGAR